MRRRQRSPARTLVPSEAAGRAGMCMCARFCVGDTALLSGWEDGSISHFELRKGYAERHPFDLKPHFKTLSHLFESMLTLKLC